MTMSPNAPFADLDFKLVALNISTLSFLFAVVAIAALCENPNFLLFTLEDS